MRAPCRPCLLAAALAALLLAAPAQALDAQALYEKVKGSMVVVYRMANDNRAVGLGSGFAVGDGTLVVTTQQMVSSASSYVVLKTAEGNLLRDVKVLRVSVESDLAILKIPVALPPMELSPGPAQVGQEVAAVGTPKGVEGLLTTGVVSGVRTYKNWPIKGLIQTTAPFYKGSTGSPLMDGQGRVVGVVNSYVKDGQNLNFAVPVEILRRLLGRDLAPAGGSVPAASDTPAAPAGQSSGSLEVKTAPDGSITIIQQRPKQ